MSVYITLGASNADGRPLMPEKDHPLRTYYRKAGAYSHHVLTPPRFKGLSREQYGYIDLDRPYRSSITVELPEGMLEAINSPDYSFLQFWDFHNFLDVDNPNSEAVDTSRETSTSTPCARFMPEGVIDGEFAARIEVRFHGSILDWTVGHQYEMQEHVCLGGLSARKWHDPTRFRFVDGTVKGGKHWRRFDGVREGRQITLTIEESKNVTSGWGHLLVNGVQVWEYVDRPNCMPSPKHPKDSGIRYPYEGVYNRSATVDSALIIHDHTFEYLE